MKKSTIAVLAVVMLVSIALASCAQPAPMPSTEPMPTTPAPTTAPEPAPEPTTDQPSEPPAYDEVIALLSEAEAKINHMEVYLDNSKFEEARQSILDAQLTLADVKTLKSEADLTESEEKDIELAIEWFTEVMIGLSTAIDVLEMMATGDWLTWGPYHEVIGGLNSAIDRMSSAQEIGSGITDPGLAEGVEELHEIIDTLREAVDMLSEEDVLGVVKIYTYIDKIDPESVRDLAIEITQEATTDKREVEEIFYYVRDTIKYVKDPRLTGLDFDYIQSPLETLERKAGDCDDHAVLLASLLESIGYGTSICFVDTDEEEPFEADHMNIIVAFDGDEYILEATCKDCKMGEYPGDMYYEEYDYAEFKAMMLEAMSVEP
jgi:predicted transglutaminase-like cysteine proteinase